MGLASSVLVFLSCMGTLPMVKVKFQPGNCERVANTHPDTLGMDLLPPPRYSNGLTMIVTVTKAK